jgi:hypothetical protein
LLEYLPVTRVVPPDNALGELLHRDEAERIRDLSIVDPDDVPSATLALLLEAFYLSNDTDALRAVYGRNADLAEHGRWVEVLQAGGDAGELGRMLGLGINVVGLLGRGASSAMKHLVMAFGPWGLVSFGLLAAVLATGASSETKQRVRSAAGSAGTILLQVSAAHQEAIHRFQQVVPAVPSWEALAGINPPECVLARACFHALARSPMSDLSAAELARELPVLGVARGGAKVRQVLRTYSCFSEIWRGRWQVGEVAPILTAYLDRVSQATL